MNRSTAPLIDSITNTMRGARLVFVCELIFGGLHMNKLIMSVTKRAASDPAESLYCTLVMNSLIYLVNLY